MRRLAVSDLALKLHPVTFFQINFFPKLPSPNAILPLFSSYHEICMHGFVPEFLLNCSKLVSETISFKL